MARKVKRGGRRSTLPHAKVATTVTRARQCAVSVDCLRFAVPTDSWNSRSPSHFEPPPCLAFSSSPFALEHDVPARQSVLGVNALSATFTYTDSQPWQSLPNIVEPWLTRSSGRRVEMPRPLADGEARLDLWYRDSVGHIEYINCMVISCLDRCSWRLC